MILFLFMKKTDDVYIQDIDKAVKKIQKYLSGADLQQFLENDLLQDGVMRQFEIIGEALNKISPQFAVEHPDFPIREAITLRNLLIHQYDQVDLEIVWETAQKDIPILKEQLKKLG